VAGSDQYPGAAALCAAACMRAGAGLATLATTPAVRQVVAARVPEVTYTPEPITLAGDPEEPLRRVRALLPAYPVLVLGPGLGRGESTTAFVRGLLEARRDLADHAWASVVIDGDGLFTLAGWDGWWERIGANVVLTPHAGELARLAGAPTGAEPEWVRAAALAQSWRCMLVAKGPHTSIANQAGEAAVWAHANPALATAGTGDVLAGAIAGLLAQGASPWDAARLGVAVHAGAAARALRQSGGRTLLASDLPEHLSPELARLADRREAGAG
jgi:NAD(P)H-hydrate epimerase